MKKEVANWYLHCILTNFSLVTHFCLILKELRNTYFIGVLAHKPQSLSWLLNRILGKRMDFILVIFRKGAFISTGSNLNALLFLLVINVSVLSLTLKKKHLET